MGWILAIQIDSSDEGPPEVTDPIPDAARKDCRCDGNDRRARPTRVIGRWPTSTRLPDCRAAARDMPMRASGGSV